MSFQTAVQTPVVMMKTTVVWFVYFGDEHFQTPVHGRPLKAEEAPGWVPDSVACHWGRSSG